MTQHIESYWYIGKDGKPITAKELEDQRDALRVEVERLREALSGIIATLDGEPEYHYQGMGCGLEDRNITDRYDAMEYGWNQAMERIFSEHINHAADIAKEALK